MGLWWVLASLILLSACSGGSGGGETGVNSLETQRYQDAIRAYQAGDFATAVSLFSQLLAEFPGGVYSDESQYRLGRSHQGLNAFAEARDTYALVSSTGSWAESAAFYSARSYYDEAGFSADPATAYALYTTAMGQLNAYGWAGLQDQATYYVGRSFHQQAVLLKGDPSLASETAQQRFDSARGRYALVRNASVFYDNSLYFTGRSYHEQVPADYPSARQYYQQLIVEHATNPSTWADDAQYQLAKTYYDEAGDVLDPASTLYDRLTAAATAMTAYDTAIVEFQKLTPSPNTLYPASNRIDGARYYKGRSLHRQAALVAVDPTLDGGKSFADYFADARVAYESVIALGAMSVYDDNAQYRLGKSYYDEAVLALALPDYALAQQKLSDAISAMTVVTTDTVYQSSNSADNAYYYLGRSYQRAAGIPAAERLVITGGSDFTGIGYANARDFYEVLTGKGNTAPAYPASAWIDNAYYETGNTWRAQVLDGSSTEPLADDTAALWNYSRVLTDYQGQSSREDNAARKVATIYDESGYCQEENDAYLYVKTLATATGNSAFVAEADTHLVDLQTALVSPTVMHPCVEDPVGLPAFASLVP